MHEGFQVQSFKEGSEALTALQSMFPEIVLLDLGLPDIDGMMMIPAILEKSPCTRIIVLTGDDSVRNAVKALQLGARHYLVKPWDHAELLLILEREHSVFYQKQIKCKHQLSSIASSSPFMAKISTAIQKLAHSPETPVFIEGETGVGKEVLSREIHAQTACAGEFVAFNCASLPGDLIESELFGHEKGAFTGAAHNKRGLVELAKHGTLLLDEITEMPFVLQAKLLRFLQEHTYRRIGGTAERKCPCRVIATTNRNIKDALDQGLLRADLFYRLAVVHLVLPPLCKRKEDIIRLADGLLNKMQTTIPGEKKTFSETSYTAMLSYSWPGNVRELKNRIERAIVLGNSSEIHPVDLDFLEKPKMNTTERDPLQQVQTTANLTLNDILKVLHENEGNISRTSRKLGIPRHRIRYLLKKQHLTK